MEMMDSKNLFKQMVDFQQAVFDTSFNTMTMVHARTEKITDMFLDQILWGYEKWKNVASDWNKACHNTSESFRRTMDDNFAKMETYYNK